MNNKTWDDFYNKKIEWDVFFEKLLDHKFYLQKIIELNPKKILEVGCGPGIRCVFLSYLGIEVIALDNDEGIIEQVNFYTKKFKGKNKAELGDAFNLDFQDREVDIIFNAGFLEHFKDIARGVIDIRDVVFFLSMIVFFLFANVVAVECKK